MAIEAQTLQAALIGYQSEQERITKAIADLQAQLKGGKASASSGLDRTMVAKKPKRKLSAAARKRIAAAQKKRWAAYHKSHKA
jgi:cell division septum initiation protein DivIVA